MIAPRFTFLARSEVTLVQAEAPDESGLACIAMIVDALGQTVSRGELRVRYGGTGAGRTVAGLLKILAELDFLARPLNTSAKRMRQLRLPAILEHSAGRFALVERVGRGRALVHDPVAGTGWLKFDEVDRTYSGRAIEIAKAESFQPGSPVPRLRLRHLWRSMIGIKRTLSQLLMLTLVLQLYSLVYPYYLQAAVDIALPALDGDLLTVLALGFGLFTILNAVAALLRSYVVASAGGTVAYGMTSNLGRHLFRLPSTWFESRHVGDILGRIQSIRPIQEFFTSAGVTTLLDGALTLLTLFIMLFYSPLLALTAIVALALYLLTRVILFPFQRSAQEDAIVTAAAEQSVIIESVRGMTVLRSHNQETARHGLWLGSLIKSVNAQFNAARLNIWATTSSTLIFGLEGILSLWLAIGFVIEGGFTVGMTFAFMAYKAQFLSRSASLVDQLTAFRMIRLHLERLADIGLAEEDPGYFQPNAHLAGEGIEQIEFRDVSFRYQPDGPDILSGLNLTVGAGEHVAITGGSGSGKSTLIRLLLGLLQPTSGQILINGRPLEMFGYRAFRDLTGSVLQDDTLFSGTIGDNVTFFDAAPDAGRIVEAATRAHIHDDIIGMPLGYGTPVGDMGSSLSGGQRQRLLLARALYRKPAVLVMDEGTAHLDPVNERQINQEISAMGITRIVVAHRRETIAAADTAYRMDHGQLRRAGQEDDPADQRETQPGS